LIKTNALPLHQTATLHASLSLIAVLLIKGVYMHRSVRLSVCLSVHCIHTVDKNSKNLCHSHLLDRYQIILLGNRGTCMDYLFRVAACKCGRWESTLLLPVDHKFNALTAHADKPYTFRPCVCFWSFFSINFVYCLFCYPSN